MNHFCLLVDVTAVSEISSVIIDLCVRATDCWDLSHGNVHMGFKYCLLLCLQPCCQLSCQLYMMVFQRQVSHAVICHVSIAWWCFIDGYVMLSSVMSVLHDRVSETGMSCCHVSIA